MRVCPREVTQSLHGYITLVGQGSALRSQEIHTSWYICACIGNNILDRLQGEGQDMNTVTGQQEMVLVPRIPTAAMLEAAKDEAMAEDASAVWREMVREFERSSIQNGEEVSR
jgi:hypothetical protein